MRFCSHHREVLGCQNSETAQDVSSLQVTTYVKLDCFQYKILTALVYPLQRKIRPKEQFLQCVGPKAKS